MVSIGWNKVTASFFKLPPLFSMVSIMSTLSRSAISRFCYAYSCTPSHLLTSVFETAPGAPVILGTTVNYIVHIC